ncbi:hypothetical protein [Streptomyces violascens]|uniref:hypothetical protein n=1 Tax=Streptomyces violascens TaxID=67381 RepID=UPI001671938C|nr:hypothetical protein [Streptomyces violascens]GGU38937.1 hypothetical protein GCM10010289_69770 [Streptomyces violascens]
MPIPRLSPGDHVRIVIAGTVEQHAPGQLELTSRTYIDFESEDDLNIEVLPGPFRRGDVVADGSRTLMRTVIDRDGTTLAFWTAPDGTVVQDNEIRPEALRLLLRTA